MFDVIVFTQDELEKTAENKKCICLCDNTFNLPLIPERTYIAIGDVTAQLDCTAEYAKSLNIECSGFEPVFTGKTIPQITDDKKECIVLKHSSSYDSSYMCAEKFEDVFVSGYGINLI